MNKTYIIKLNDEIIGETKLEKADPPMGVMEILDDLKDKCETHASKLMQINSDAMVLEMHVGLALEGVSNLKMITSYVSNLFTGYANMSFYQKIPNNI